MLALNNINWRAGLRGTVIGVLLAGLICATAAAAAPTKLPVGKVPAGKISGQQSVQTASLEKIRFSADAETVRLVFDLTAIPAYTVNLNDAPLQVEIDLPGTFNRSGLNRLSFNDDAYVDRLLITDAGGGRLKVIIPLKQSVVPKVSVLASPPRLVVDLLKTYDNRTENEIAPGVVYREIYRGRPSGPIRAFALEVDLKAGNTLRPVLSNDAVAGLEPLSAIADRLPNIAMINGPYFMRSGEIIGMMKIDKTIVSSPDVARTSFGLQPGGKIFFDTATYSGYVELPDKTRIPIDGVNRSRGESELILYNSYYAYWTLTTGEGRELTVRGDRVTEVQAGNSLIPEDGVVLSASGSIAEQLAGLKSGSRVRIVQTLGDNWDRAEQAVGAGPCLVKDGQVFVTAQGEEFGGDVAGGRAPRTAIGVNAEGRILLVVVDGRSGASVGLTLTELAEFMLELGAVDAMNLDGGGSTEMIVQGRIVNQPSDGRERRIGAGIAVIKAPKGK